MVLMAPPVLSRRVTSFAELELLHSAPLMDHALRDSCFQPAWNASVSGFTLAVRDGRIGLGKQTFPCLGGAG